MASRKLYLVAYDISSPKRLVKTLNTVRILASGGQKSAYECFLTKTELSKLSSELQRIIKEEADSVLFVPINEEKPVALLGIAELPIEQGLVYLG